MAVPDPVTSSVSELLREFRQGRLSPVESATVALARIRDTQDAVNAYVSIRDDEVLAEAELAHRRHRAGDTAPLLGIPISIKDVFHVAGSTTTFGSALHRDHRAKRDSGAVARLRRAGALIIGKTNTAEFGQSATTDNLLGPDTSNPWDTSRTSGGSSGGAAASVATGSATLALGSDGGGSIRIPAAFTGLVGIKPTYMSCPDEGGMRAMSAFSCPGLLARTVADARIGLQVLQGTDRCDPGPAGPLRIVVDEAPEDHPVEPGIRAVVRDAVDSLADCGHIVREGRIPVQGWMDAFGPLVVEEEHRERGPWLDHVPELLSGYEADALRAGRQLTPEKVARGWELQRAFEKRMADWFTDVDIVVTPTVATPAFPLQTRPTLIDGRKVGRLWGAFPFTAPFNVARVPALTLPCGLVGGLPVGVQLVAAQHDDVLLLRVAEQLEQRLAPSALLERGGHLIPTRTG